MKSTIGILKQIIDFLYEESKKDDPQSLKIKMEILEQELSKKNTEIENLYTENSKLEIILWKYESDFELLANMCPVNTEQKQEVKQEKPETKNEEHKKEQKQEVKKEEQKKEEVKPEPKKEEQKEPEKRNRRDYMREYQRAYRKKQREAIANISMTV
jgi:outer membrane biosynthesis protein TonB